ncbi:juvenile hormone esterase isoform X2 [Calliopsis andreniformis]|uniref:juvenile hormone esterase isoform X2 n=1 Tax=Calliopsis andreniformis TaxID=337506 RepID=UPI003FCE91BA
MCAVQSSREKLCSRSCWHLSHAAILLLLTAAAANAYSTRIWTKFGQVQGLWSRSSSGRLAAHYLGIPYAEPPLGELRFRSPQPWNHTWNDTYYALKDATPCTQMKDNGDVVGSEDCLYLNIFVPMAWEDSEAKRKLPVMVYIHGGKFTKGNVNSHEYAPDYLMDHDVILVTLTYRLNIFGFFSTGNKVSPGNYALKDVVMALRWIHENIESFHGDPNSVTLWGHSSGAAVAHALALTKKTEGLFNRYIMQSGNMLSISLFNSKHKIRRASLKAASLLNCLPQMEESTELVTDSATNENSTRQPEKVTEPESHGTDEEDNYSEEEDEEITRCMRSVDAETLVKVLQDFNVWRGNPCCTFGPAMEDDSDDAILTMHPREIIKNYMFRDLPCMIGVVEGDGLVKSMDILAHPEVRDALLNNLEDYLLLLLEYQGRITNTTAFISAITDFYFDGNITENLLRNITELEGDALIISSLYQTLKYHSEFMKSNIYFYSFSYRGTFSHTFKYGTLVRYGAAHGDELNYLFPLLNRMFETEMLHNTEDDILMINIMTEMWTSFAKKGVPEAWKVPAWPDYKISHEYLQLGDGKSPDIIVQSDFLPERMAFWEEITEKLIIDDTDFVTELSIKKAEPNASTSRNSNISILCLLIIHGVYFL